MFDFFFPPALKSRRENEDGWGNVSEERCFMVLMWPPPCRVSARVDRFYVERGTHTWECVAVNCM